MCIVTCWNLEDCCSERALDHVSSPGKHPATGCSLDSPVMRLAEAKMASKSLTCQAASWELSPCLHYLRTANTMKMKGHSNLVYQEKTEQNKDHPQLGEGRRKRTYQTFTPLCTPLLTGSASAGRIAESRNCRTEPHTGDTMAASAMSYS